MKRPNPIKARCPNTTLFQKGNRLSAAFVVLVVSGKGGRDKVENVRVPPRKPAPVTESLWPLEKVWLFKNRKKNRWFWT